jgi:polyisoprenoid-binding protein YceI
MGAILKTMTAVFLVLVPTVVLGSTWNIDPDHTNVGFKVKHLYISNVKGVFGKVHGVVTIDDTDLGRSSVTATIDTTSIDTGVSLRDKDLRSEKYLDVAKYPAMTFVSTKVERNGDGKLKVTGNLTLHGVTRPVVLDVEGPTPEVKDPMGKLRRGASASTTISRKEFGIDHMEGPIGDEIGISLEVEMVKGEAK